MEKGYVDIVSFDRHMYIYILLYIPFRGVSETFSLFYTMECHHELLHRRLALELVRLGNAAGADKSDLLKVSSDLSGDQITVVGHQHHETV